MAHYVNGSAAVDLNYGQEAFEYEEALQQPSRRLTVVPGSRPQGAQEGQKVLSPIVVTAIKCAVAFAAVVAVAAVARILLMAIAFGFASQNAQLTTQLDEARSLGSELEVQQSVYGNADRILALATDVYGMVPASGTDVIDLSGTAASADAAAQTE